MKTTFSRTLTTVLCILLIPLLIIGTVFQSQAKQYMVDTAVQELENDAQVVVELACAAYDGQALNTHDFIVALSVAYAVSGSDVVLCDSQGRLLLCGESPLGCEHQGLTVGKEFLENVFSEGSVVQTGILEGLYEDARYVVAKPVVKGTQRLGIAIVSAPIQSALVVIERISDIFLYISVLVAMMSLVLMGFFARQQSSPLKEMASAARAFGHGELNARVKTDGNYTEEMQELALSFNNMASSLQKSEYQRREFVANVSHELKTPMTTISGYVDGILDGTIPQERHRHYLQVVSDETKRLNRLVRSMLDISQLQDQGGIPEEQMIHFDLCECAGQVLITFEQKIMNKGLDVQVEMPEHPVYTIANRDYITQVIYNLVDNAVKFCPAGGVLALTVQEGGSKAYVSVANDGETIPPEELPLVFDRFHKTDKSRTQNRDSWGLGLYIVKTIVCSHGENISVTSREGRTTFTFTMPLVN